MQPRSLEAILSELDNSAGYGSQIQNIRNQQNLIPGQIADEEQGLQAKQGQAFDDILGGARRRGLGFSGIPLQEQAKYTSTEFLPAMARLRSQGKQQAMSLEDSILGIQERRTNQALGIRTNEQQMAEQQRQFNEQMAAQRRAQAASSGAGSSWMSALQGGGGQPQAGPKFAPRQGGGFDFTDDKNQPISAAKYAMLSGVPLGELLYSMGQQGDTYAQKAYNHIADYQQRGLTPGAGLKSRYSSIFWGT